MAQAALDSSSTDEFNHELNSLLCLLELGDPQALEPLVQHGYVQQLLDFATARAELGSDPMLYSRLLTIEEAFCCSAKSHPTSRRVQRRNRQLGPGGGVAELLQMDTAEQRGRPPGEDDDAWWARLGEVCNRTAPPPDVELDSDIDSDISLYQ